MIFSIPKKDGLTIDEAGNVWVTSAGGLYVYE